MPSDSIERVRLASPGLSRGSVTAPARTTSLKATMGRPRLSTTITLRPLSSSRLVGTGGLKAAGAAPTGITDLSTAPAEAVRRRSGSTDSLTKSSPMADEVSRCTSSAVTAM